MGISPMEITRGYNQCDTSIYSQELADSALQPVPLEEYKQLSLWNLTPTHNKYCDRNSQASQSTATSGTTLPNEESLTLSQWDSLVSAQAKQELEQDYLTQNQPYGERDLDACWTQTPNSALSNSPKELSIEDLEQSLDTSTWQDILQNLSLSRRVALEQDIKDSDYLSFPTLTSGKSSSKTRPAGQTKCEKWFKDKQLVTSGSQLSAPAIALIMGFPNHWFNSLSPTAPQAESKPDIWQDEALPQDKQQSPYPESFISIHSSGSSPNSIAKTFISCDRIDINPQLSPSKIHQRSKGEGSGTIYFRQVTKKNKTYQQAYFHYEQWSNGSKICKTSRYIPVRKLDTVINLNNQKAPIAKILNLLHK